MTSGAGNGSTQGTELFPYTFATWVFTLHVDGVPASDDGIRAACDAIRAATEPGAGNQAADRLVARIRELVPDADPRTVEAAARRLYGDRLRTDLGAASDRDGRTAAIRKYQFASQLPWLARIWEREGDRVRPGWLLIERVTDVVRAADPNPWNDVDEGRELPVSDFHVLWELDGTTNLHLG
ncbi:MAG: hypothetical protein ABMB14_04450 [Myxococcota bacterium]